MSCLPDWLSTIERDLESPLARKALRTLRSEPTAFVSVGEWANRLHVSREHLTRSISPTINPHALLQATRLILAMEKLAAQDRLKAGDALDLMGYSSRAHAFTVFKSLTGVTPTEWWQRYHGQVGIRKMCVVDRCPIVGALMDRSHSRIRENGRPVRFRQVPSEN